MQQFTTHICIFIWSHHSVTSNIYLTGDRMHRQEYHLSVPLRIGRGRKKNIIDVSFFEFFCPHWIILLNWLLLFGYPFSFPSELSVILVKFWLDRNSTNLFLLYINSNAFRKSSLSYCSSWTWTAVVNVLFLIFFHEEFRDLKGVYQRSTDNTMANRKKNSKGQTSIYKKYI